MSAAALPANAPVRHQRRHQLRADFRVLRGLAKAALDTDRPLMAHVVLDAMPGAAGLYAKALAPARRPDVAAGLADTTVRLLNPRKPRP